jgi:hypothetical protein
METPNGSSQHGAPDSVQPPSPSAASQRFPTWKQALLMLLGGIVLAVTACFGFLISFGSNFERGGDAFFTPAAALLFVAGVIITLVGAVFVTIRTARAVMHPDGERTSAPRGDA